MVAKTGAFDVFHVIGTVEVISMPIGQRVLSLIRIVLLGRSTHAGDVRPNELIIRPTHQHQEALSQYPWYWSRVFSHVGLEGSENSNS
jgi:hypothetical protein